MARALARYHMATCVYVTCVLGSEVNKLFKILIKISNVMEYIGYKIQNIEAPRVNNPIILYI